MNGIFEKWKAELLANFDITMHGCADDDAYALASARYDELIEEVLASNDPRRPLVLMELFSDEQDYGVLESCFRVLTNLPDSAFMPALLKSLPKLMEKTTYWTNDLFRFAIQQKGFNKFVRKEATDAEKAVLKHYLPAFKNCNQDLMEACNRLSKNL